MIFPITLCNTVEKFTNTLPNTLMFPSYSVNLSRQIIQLNFESDTLVPVMQEEEEDNVFSKDQYSLQDQLYLFQIETDTSLVVI